MANTRISEKIKIRRIQPCGDANEIYLAWINSRGGIEQYLFQANYTINRAVGNSLTTSKFVEDYETGEAFISMIKKDALKELGLITPDCDEQTRIGLAEILSSPMVKILRNGLNSAWDSINPGPLWHEVIVQDGSFDQGDSNEDLFDFTLRLNMQPYKTLWR